MYSLANNNNADRFTWDAEAEHAYWLAQEQKTITTPVEISVGAFHEAAGRYLSINWMYCVDAQTDSESFMSVSGRGITSSETVNLAHTNIYYSG